MLILTSFGFQSPIMREKLRPLIPSSGKTVLVIPAAGFDPKDSYRWEGRALMEYGFDRYDIINGMEVDPDSIPKVDYIYIPGGNTFRLLHFLQEQEMMPKLLRLIKKGSVYIGVSAGAVLAGEDLRYVTLMDECSDPVTDFSGLKLVPEIVMAHSDQVELSVRLRSKMLSPNRDLLNIPNTGAAVYRRNEEGGFTYVDHL